MMWIAPIVALALGDVAAADAAATDAGVVPTTTEDVMTPAASEAEASSEAPAEDAPSTSAPVARASSEPAANAIFAEALGNGLLYSINYERFVDAWHVGFRGGASYFTYAVSRYGGSGNLTLVSFPIVLSYYIGTPRHKLQLGLGGTILYSVASTDSAGTEFGGERTGVGLAFTGVIGYRYVPPDGGISFGVGFTPLLRASRFLPWGGANVGYVF